MMLCSLCAAPSGTAFRVPAVVGSGGMHLIRKGMSCDHHLVRQLASSSFLKQAIRAPAFGQGPLLQTAKREDRDDDDDALLVDSEESAQSSLMALYLSHFSCTLGDRMWEFAIPFFILALNRADSMSFTIFYAIFLGFVNIFGAPIIGYLIDKYSRFQSISFCVVIKAASVLISLLVMDLALGLSFTSGGVIQALVFILIATCSVASLASFASSHSLDRDWVRALNDDEPDRIEKSERVVRRIRVGSRAAAPLVAVTVLAFVPPKAAAAGIALWDCVAHVINYNILRKMYIMKPRLSQPKNKRLRGYGQKGGPLLSPTQTLVRVQGRSRWLLAYQAAWRDFFDIDGNGVLTRSEINTVIASGFMRCWDLWVGVLVAASCFFYVRNILALPFI